MRLVNSFIAESRNFNAAAAADRLIGDLLESGLFNDRTWFTEDETDGLETSGMTVWYITRHGYVSSSTFDDNGEEVNWSPIAGGAWSDRLYVLDGQIRHTARSYPLTPPDMIMICS